MFHRFERFPLTERVPVLSSAESRDGSNMVGNHTRISTVAGTTFKPTVKVGSSPTSLARNESGDQ